ncbi:hypothetical protein ACFQ3N_08350 [Virgibacillus byunsanensis]|uniref:Uncharacterized protein n=1 Tax=Virgibacillus byunsanensis TaxID=570945 RepID=A0ABW3LMD0_9BACI
MSIKIFRPASVLLMGFSSLLFELTHLSIFEFFVRFFALIAILSFLPYLTKVPKILIISLLGVSSILYVVNGSLYEGFIGLNMNATILMIFIFVPLLSIPIKFGDYLTQINNVLTKYMKSTIRLYLFIKFSVLGVGSIMGMGTVPLIYHLTNTKVVRLYQPLQISAIGRGFSLSFLWSPYYISIAFMISYYNVNWIEIAPFGLVFTLLGTIVGVILLRKYNQKLEVSLDRNYDGKKAKKKLLELVSIIALITFVSIIIDSQVDQSMLTVISLVAIITSFIWSLFFQSFKSYLQSLYQFTQERVPAMGNELSLFIAAGVIGHAILISGADQLMMIFLDTVGVTHTLVVIPVVSMVILVFSYIGVLSIVPITVVTIALSASPLYMDDHLILALGTLLIWSITVVSSPFSGVNLLMASLTKKNPFEYGLKLNLKFSIVFWITGYLALVVIYYLI